MECISQEGMLETRERPGRTLVASHHCHVESPFGESLAHSETQAWSRADNHRYGRPRHCEKVE